LTRIGLISDTHGFLDEKVFSHFKDVDEIWHGGDFGSIELADALSAFKPLRGVYGNIDGPELRHRFPETLSFQCEELPVTMIHIGGYPGRYSKEAKALIRDKHPGLFISGHSHILKVMYDKSIQCLHMNPGAAGRQGWHKTRTLLRFVVDNREIRDCEVVELGGR
jgi:uncharacterized protein